LIVRWAARGRAVDPPGSAQSGILTLPGALPDGGDLRCVLNRRPDTPDAYEETYEAAEPVRTGQWPLSLRLYAEPDGAGALVGRADALVRIHSDGSGIDDVAVEGLVERVEVPDGQAVLYPEKKWLIFTARDGAGSILPVTPGSGFFEVVQGAERLRIGPDQRAEGLLPGVASVSASVDGVRSAPATVRVISNVEVKVTPARTDPLSVGATVRFAAEVTGDTPDRDIAWSATGGAITLDGVYTAPQAPGEYRITAASVFDPGKRAEAVVVVQSGALPVILE